MDPYEKGDEHAEAGYYSVKLLPAAIQAELTSTMRTGVHRYTYPGNELAGLLIDAGAVIQVGGDEPGKTTGVSTGDILKFCPNMSWQAAATCAGAGDTNSLIPCTSISASISQYRAIC